MNLLDAYILAAAEADTDTRRACCTFAQRMCELAYGAGPTGRAPNSLWNLWPDTKDPWGPVNACVKAGLNVVGTFSQVTLPGERHVLKPGTHRVQGWRGQPFAKGVSGHTITVRVPPSGPLVLVLDSAAKDRAGNVRGPREQLVDWRDYAGQYTGGIASCMLREV